MALPFCLVIRGLVVYSAVATFACGSACAQVSFELRTRLALGWGDDAVPIREPLVITQPGTYNFEFQEGVYDTDGFINYGVANWIGRILSSEPGLSQPNNPRVPPFNNSIGRDGVVSSDGTAIGDITSGYIDATVGMIGYEYEDFAPPPPPPHGAGEYAAIYRFSLTITDLTARDITLTAESLGVSYTPIAGWHVFSDTPPKAGEPGYIEYVPIVLNAAFGEHAPSAFATIRVVPGLASSAALVLSISGLFVRRRRPA